MIITTQQILALRPCAAWSEARIASIVGDGITPEQIAADERISIADRRWVLTRLCAALPDGRQRLVLWAAGCAQDVAHLARDEDAARRTIATVVAWVDGCATVDDVRAAYADAAYADAADAAARAAAAAAYADAADVGAAAADAAVYAADAAAAAADAAVYVAAAAAAAAYAAAYAAAAAAARRRRASSSSRDAAYGSKLLARRHLLDLAAAMEGGL